MPPKQPHQWVTEHPEVRPIADAMCNFGCSAQQTDMY